MGDSSGIEPKQPEHAPLQQAASAEPACAQDPLNDNLNLVSQGFLWLNQSAQREIETVRREIKQADTPSWEEKLVEHVLDVALIASGARSGAIVAERLLPTAGEALEGELVKKMFEEGLPLGMKALGTTLQARHKSPADAFVDSFAKGVEKLHYTNHERFDVEGRYRIKTADEAKALAQACSNESRDAAAIAHGNECRDAWVTFVAQAKFGSMATQQMRDEVNARVPGYMPDKAPSLEGAMVGAAPGVLEIAATLPEIKDGQMRGKPTVELAMLNGINEAVREEYEGRPLSEMNIPRQIRCSVEGELPDFALNLNEHGGQVGWLKHAQSAWLRARATVGKAANESSEGSDTTDEGLRLLLSDLVPRSIRGKLI